MDVKNIQVSNFLSIINREIKNFENSMDVEKLVKACEMIVETRNKGGRVHITGIGKPSHVSSYIASLFSSIGVPTYVLDATEAIHGSSGQVVSGDIVIAISNSGETKELMNAIHCLLANGAYIISLTRNEDSPLAKKSHITLKARVEFEGDDLNKPPRASIVGEILMLQALSILLQDEQKLTKEDYVKWHPGGKIGSSIMEGEK